MKLDPTKPVQTRDGRKARIICSDRVGYNEPIVALVTYGDGTERHHSFTVDGRYIAAREDDVDLINIPVKQLWNKPEHIAPFVGKVLMRRKGKTSFGVLTGWDGKGPVFADGLNGFYFVDECEYTADLGKPIEQMQWKDCEILY